jgi:hypothetical protein
MSLYSAAWGLITQADAVPRPLASEPLATAYAMLANLYEQHTPPIANTPITEASGAGAREVVIPCAPSADDLDYVFRLVGTKASGALSVTVTISEYVSSSWSAIVSSASTALGSGTDFDVEIALAPIDGDARALKLEIAAAGANYQMQACAVYPDSANISAPEGTTAAGYVGAADGLLGSANSPITVEHLNRLAESSRAVYRDRKQAVVGFAQPVGRSSRLIGANSWPYGAVPQTLGTSRLYIPTTAGQADITLASYGEETITGTQYARIRFQVTGKEPVEVELEMGAGSPAFDTATTTIPLTPTGYCDVKIAVDAQGSGRVYPYAVIGWWTP